MHKIEITYSQMERERRRQKKLALIKLRNGLIKLKKITKKQAELYEKCRRNAHIKEIIERLADEGRIVGVPKSKEPIPADKINYPRQYTFHIDVGKRTER